MDWDASDVVPALLFVALITLVLSPFASHLRAAFLFLQFMDRGFR